VIDHFWVLRVGGGATIVHTCPEWSEWPGRTLQYEAGSDPPTRWRQTALIGGRARNQRQEFY